MDDGLTWRGCAAVFVAATCIQPGGLLAGSQASSGFGESVLLTGPPTTTRSSQAVEFDCGAQFAASQPVLEILDAAGRVIRRLSAANSPSSDACRVSWDLRHEGGRVVEPEGEPSRLPGPRVAPGRYQVQLRVGANGGVAATTTISVLRDSDDRATDMDLVTWVELVRQAHDVLDRGAEMVVGIRGLKQQVAERVKGARSPVIGLAGDVVTRKLTDVERLVGPGPVGGVAPSPAVGLLDRMRATIELLEERDERPSSELQSQVASLAASVMEAESALLTVQGNEITAYNELLRNAMMEPLVLPRWRLPGAAAP